LNAMDYVPEDHPEYYRLAARGIGRGHGFRDFIPEAEASAIREAATQEQPPEMVVREREVFTCEYPGCGKEVREVGYRQHLRMAHKVLSFKELAELLDGIAALTPEEAVPETGAAEDDAEPEADEEPAEDEA
jgi:hypothetical protein